MTPENLPISSFSTPYDNTEIWIADNVVIKCRARYSWFRKMVVRLLTGWVIKDIK